MFRGEPEHRGVARSALFAGQGGVKWRFQTRDVVRSTPAVTATRVFIGSGDSTLYALDRATGRLVWKFVAGGPVHSSPAVAHGLVVAATLGGRIFAVDEGTGRLRRCGRRRSSWVTSSTSGATTARWSPSIR